MAKKYSKMTKDEKICYWETYYATRDTLRFAIVDLTVAANDAALSSDSSAIDAEKLRLVSELVRLQNDSTAVAADDDAITPPEDADVANVKALADKVDKMTATAKTFEKVVDLAGQALATYAKVHEA